MAIGIFLGTDGSVEEYSYDPYSFEVEKKLGTVKLEVTKCSQLQIWQHPRSSLKDGYRLLILSKGDSTDENSIATLLAGVSVYGDAVVMNIGIDQNSKDLHSSELAPLVALAEITPVEFGSYFDRIDPKHRGEDRLRQRRVARRIKKKFHGTQWHNKLVPELR